MVESLRGLLLVGFFSLNKHSEQNVTLLAFDNNRLHDAFTSGALSARSGWHGDAGNNDVRRIIRTVGLRKRVVTWFVPESLHTPKQKAS